MEKAITVGPIKRRKIKNSVNSEIRKKINKMKLGEYFEVSGVNQKNMPNLRAAISYISKKDGCKVITKFNKNTLSVESIRK